MIKDTDKALDVIGNVIEHDNWVVNYPYGSYNAGVIDYIKRKGCKLGLTINVGIADNKVHDKYLLPRLNCNDFPPKSENYITIGSTK